MEHESRLTSELRRLLSTQRTAALATVDPDGRPYVSLVPYAVDTSAPRLVLSISGLAAHTGHIRRDPHVSLLIADPGQPGQPVHALSRLTLSARAGLAEPGQPEAEALRQVYLRRFPEAEPIAQLPDFRYAAVHVRAVRQVAGFGAARDVAMDSFERLLRSM